MCEARFCNRRRDLCPSPVARHLSQVCAEIPCHDERCASWLVSQCHDDQLYRPSVVGGDVTSDDVPSPPAGHHFEADDIWPIRPHFLTMIRVESLREFSYLTSQVTGTKNAKLNFIKEFLLGYFPPINAFTKKKA